MASQGSKNSQGYNESNKSVAQTEPLSTRAASFMQHNYHQIHLYQKPKNHCIELEHEGYPSDARALITILQNHLLTIALTISREDVPTTYLSQFWLSCQVETIENHGLYITGYATHRASDKIALLSINKAKLRNVLGLPTKKDLKSASLLSF